MNWKREPTRTCPVEERHAKRPDFNLGNNFELGRDISRFLDNPAPQILFGASYLWKKKHPELIGVFLENYFCKGIWLGYALPRMRLTLVPHFGQMPCAMRRPESETFTEPSNWTLSLHFTQ